MQRKWVEWSFLAVLGAVLFVCPAEGQISCETNFTGKQYDLESLTGILLTHPNQYNRQKAAEALEEMGNPLAANALVTALADESLYVREAAANALSRLGEPVVESVIAGLKQENLLGRKNAVRLLGEMNDPRAVEPLTEVLLNDSYWKIRAEAADALAKLNDPRSVKSLIEARGDEDTRVVWKAAEAVQKITKEHALQKPEE